MRIPSNNRWIQLNNGDIQGALYETHNMNFDRGGVAQLSQKSYAFMNDIVADGGDVDFKQVMSVVGHDSGDITVVTSGKTFSGDLDCTFLTNLDTAPELSALTDSVVVFGAYNSNRLYVVDGSTMKYHTKGSPGSWTSTGITDFSTAAGDKHPMCSFDSLPTYKLAVGDKNTVRIFDNAGASTNEDTTNKLTLPPQYNVTSLAYRSGYLYVGTKTDEGQEARVFIWNGSGTNAQSAVPVGTGWILSLVPYKNTVAGITDAGEIFAVSGTSKVTLGGLPVYFAEAKRWDAVVAATNGNVLSQGMTVIGDRIYVNIEAEVSTNDFYYPQASGIWCYDPQIGVYHYTTSTTDVVVTDNSLSRSGNELTTSANHGLVTGDPIYFLGISSLTGVTQDVVYYAIVVDANTISVAGNRYDADQGNALTLGGTPDSSDNLTYVTNTDHGSLTDSLPGAIAATGHRTTAKEIFETDILYGSEPYNLANTVEQTCQGMVDSWNVGWFTTQKIYTNNITQNWHEVYLLINKALLSNEQIIVKYRAEDKASIPTKEVTGTWSSTTQLSTTDQKVGNQVAVGDEIMITRGQGQGRLAHITAVSVASDTTTITIDETLGSVTNTALQFMVTGFKKALAVTGTREQNNIVRAPLNVKSSWIQIKVELRGFGIEVAGIELTNGPDNYAV
jgi:hypothetical protein